MARPQSQSEAYATGYHLAARSLTESPSDFTIMHCRQLWTEQRDSTREGPVRWGLDGMLAALDDIERGIPIITRYGEPAVATTTTEE